MNSPQYFSVSYIQIYRLDIFFKCKDRTRFSSERMLIIIATGEYTGSVETAGLEMSSEPSKSKNIMQSMLSGWPLNTTDIFLSKSGKHQTVPQNERRSSPVHFWCCNICNANLGSKPSKGFASAKVVLVGLRTYLMFHPANGMMMIIIMNGNRIYKKQYILLQSQREFS